MKLQRRDEDAKDAEIWEIKMSSIMRRNVHTKDQIVITDFTDF